jgi:hypothetical protein
LIWNFYWLFVSIVTMDLFKIVQVRPLFYFIFHKYIFLFVISYFEQIFIFTHLLLLWFNVKNRILVFHSIFDSSFYFFVVVHVSWFWGQPYIWWLTDCFKTLFLTYCKT